MYIVHISLSLGQKLWKQNCVLFGRIEGKMNCFWNFLSFTISRLLSILILKPDNRTKQIQVRWQRQSQSLRNMYRCTMGQKKFSTSLLQQWQTWQIRTNGPTNRHDRNLINRIVNKKVRWNGTNCTLLLKKLGSKEHNKDWCHLWTISIKVVLEF